MKVLPRAVVAAAAATLFACEASLPISARAAQVESNQCAGVPAGPDEQRLMRRIAVLKAESKCHVDYCSGVAQVFAVRLVVRAPAGVTAEQLGTLLRCHGARALLGEVDRSQLGDDPYWLPGSWVDIDVRDAANSFVVTLTGNTVTDNLHILRRAEAFAAQRGTQELH
jgi:hypothetical protein